MNDDQESVFSMQQISNPKKINFHLSQASCDLAASNHFPIQKPKFVERPSRSENFEPFKFSSET
jgi:hypothetical protein